MIIVDLIKEFMYQKNKTIADVAKGTGLSADTIRNIVVNDIIPSPEVADKILRYFGASLEEVLILY